MFPTKSNFSKKSLVTRVKIHLFNQYMMMDYHDAN